MSAPLGRPVQGFANKPRIESNYQKKKRKSGGESQIRGARNQSIRQKRAKKVQPGTYFKIGKERGKEKVLGAK